MEYSFFLSFLITKHMFLEMICCVFSTVKIYLYCNCQSYMYYCLLMVLLFFIYKQHTGTKIHEIYNAWDINHDGGIDVNEFQTQVNKKIKKNIKNKIIIRKE